MASEPELLLWEVLDVPELLELLEAEVGAELGEVRLPLELLELLELLEPAGVEVTVEVPLSEWVSGNAPMIPKVPATPATAMPSVAMVVLAIPRRGS